nr:hypothetical protein [Streptomyces microflavus]
MMLHPELLRAARTARRPLGSWQQADLGAALGDGPGRDWIVHGLAFAGIPGEGSPPGDTPPAPSTPPALQAPSAPTTPSGKEEHP